MACPFVSVLLIVLNVAWWIIIIQAIMSWLVAFNVINTTSDPVRKALYALDRMTDPLYRPVRKFMPDLGALDISPMVVLLGVILLDKMLRTYFPFCPV